MSQLIERYKPMSCLMTSHQPEILQQDKQTHLNISGCTTVVFHSGYSAFTAELYFQESRPSLCFAAHV